jgi:hypothetical protein
MIPIIDTRMAILFSLPIHKYTLPARATEPLIEPSYCDAECIDHSTRQDTAFKFSVLRRMCARYRLHLHNTGRFFVISEASNTHPKTLKGFIMPQTTEWCWFYGSKGSPKTAHFAQEEDAAEYVRTFFSSH